MNIYVGNLAPTITEEQLRHEFSPFGEVTSITIRSPKQFGNGQTRSYGYVEMPSKTDGELAIAGLHGKLLEERSLAVMEALPLSNQKQRSRNHKNKHSARSRR
jgi:RNA recognition motif-containing protein